MIVLLVGRFSSSYNSRTVILLEYVAEVGEWNVRFDRTQVIMDSALPARNLKLLTKADANMKAE